jgi:hypothetical protein
MVSTLREILLASNKLKVKMLVYRPSQIEEMISAQLKEFFQKQIENRFLEPPFQSKSMVIIFDKMLVLAIEIKDFGDKYFEGKSLNEIGFATYSNSESTVDSYDVIFENLWIQSKETEYKSK